MKKLFSLSIALLFTQFTSLAQEGWFWQNPLPQGDKLNDVCVVNEDIILAVGNLGTIFKTTNGGADWFEQLSGTTYNLYSIQFTDSNTGWAIGNTTSEIIGNNKSDANSIVLKTTNGGEEWFTILNTTSAIYSACFINNDTGWLAGSDGNLLKTTNGGENWFSPPTPDITPYKVFFLNDTIGFIVDGNRWWDNLFKTTDGGVTWTYIRDFNRITSFYFTDNLTGWISSRYQGLGGIHKTTDGGENWELQLSACPINSVYFLNDTDGWAVGGNELWRGAIFYTTNSGVDWLEHSTSSAVVELHSVHFSDNKGSIVGDGGVVFLTTNSGVDWVEQTKNATLSSINSIFFTNRDTGWVAGGGIEGFEMGYGTLSNTVSGGEEWAERLFDSTIALYSVQFLNDNTGYAVGETQNWDGLILYTNNGGNSWKIQLQKSESCFGSVYFIDENNGWAIGTEILYTTNGGGNWITQLDSVVGLNSVYFVDDKVGWAVGYQPGGVPNPPDGYILKTTNGGEDWLFQGTGYTQLNSVYFIDLYVGWIVGGWPSTILMTMNGGLTWSEQFNDAQTILRSVFFTDSNSGWAVGGDAGVYGTVLKTTNMGANWIEQKVTSNELRSVFFIDNNTGWVAGYDGTILKTTNGGVTFIQENEINEIPTNYSLSNNYPNPFNPRTKINYSILQASKVVIKVFDILGNEIETLVNEEKPMGTYELTWNAANLPSGVYFYQLRAVDPSTSSGQVFVQTKKMVLMK